MTDLRSSRHWQTCMHQSGLSRKTRPPLRESKSVWGGVNGMESRCWGRLLYLLTLRNRGNQQVGSREELSSKSDQGNHNLNLFFSQSPGYAGWFYDMVEGKLSYLTLTDFVQLTSFERYFSTTAALVLHLTTGVFTCQQSFLTLDEEITWQCVSVQTC